MKRSSVKEGLRVAFYCSDNTKFEDSVRYTGKIKRYMDGDLIDSKCGDTLIQCDDGEIRFPHYTTLVKLNKKKRNVVYLAREHVDNLLNLDWRALRSLPSTNYPQHGYDAYVKVKG